MAIITTIGGGSGGGGGGLVKDVYNFAAANNRSATGLTLTQASNTGGTAVLTTLASGRGFSLAVPQNTANSDNQAAATLTVPGQSAWTLTGFVMLNSQWSGPSFNDYASGGLVILDNTGKYIQFGWTAAGTQGTSNMGVEVWNSFTSFGSRQQWFDSTSVGNPVWLRATLASSNFTFSTSLDGESWVQKASIAQSTLGTLSSVGVIADANSRTFGSVAQESCTLTCFHLAAA
jgi:hypothetical protein